MDDKKLVFDKEFLRSGEGGYVFLSHSHKDIEDVRTIRNVFEQKGFEPLCFFLKCLSDDDEVEDLIKREIDARDFFVYVDSENAQNSRWVRTEREYVKKSGKNQNSIFRINLEDFKNNQQSKVELETKVERIAQLRKIFISYSIADKEFAYEIAKALKKRDFNVLLDLDDFNFQVGDNIFHKMTDTMKYVAEYGCVIPIISEYTSDELFFNQNQLTFASMLGADFYPICIGSEPIELPQILKDKEVFYMKEIQSDEEINRFINYIENCMYQKYDIE